MTTTEAGGVAEAEGFLRAFHAAHPAVTSQTMGDGRGPDGRSSYGMLRDRVRGCRRVLDLGCGDGLLLQMLAEDGGRQSGRAAGEPRLAGVDLSPAELELARRRTGVTDAALAIARAQQLPLRDGSFDACVSHMALMLMGDMERVAAELARVLVPGGVFAAAVGGGAAGGEAYELFLELLRPALDAAPAGRRMPVLGDRRTRSRAGLEEIFGRAGFGAADWETVRIDLSGTAEQVWSRVGGMYDLAVLEAEGVAGLRERFLARAAGLALPDGQVPCAMRVHVVTVRSVGRE